MGFLDRLFGRTPAQQQPYGQQGYGQTAYPQQGGMPTLGQPQDAGTPQAARSGGSEDERAVAKYRYLLRTAPPEKIEQAHAEAFAQLTPEQRQMVLQQMSQDMPAGEAPQTADPQQMARAATRMELQRPGYLESTWRRGSFGGMGMGGMGMGMGGSIMGSMMGTIAGVVVGSAIADAMFDHDYYDSPEAHEVGDTGGDAGDGGADYADTGDQGYDQGDQGDQGYDQGADVGSDGGGLWDGGGDSGSGFFDGGGFDGGGFDGGGFGDF